MTALTAGAPPTTGTGVLDWIAGRVAAFRALDAELFAMQRRATALTIAAEKANRPATRATARAQIDRLGALRNLHAATMEKLGNLATVLRTFHVPVPPGLEGVPALIIPAAVLTAALLAATYMWRVITTASAESRVLAETEAIVAKLDAGAVTPDQARDLLTALGKAAPASAKPPPPGGASTFGGELGKYAGLALLAVAGATLLPPLLDRMGRGAQRGGMQVWE